jgi:hypothetical protein
VYGVSNIREGMLRVEKKTNVSGNEERGNVEADHVCGRARKMALTSSAEIMWLETGEGE